MMRREEENNSRNGIVFHSYCHSERSEESLIDTKK